MGISPPIHTITMENLGTVNATLTTVGSIPNPDGLTVGFPIVNDEPWLLSSCIESQVSGLENLADGSWNGSGIPDTVAQGLLNLGYAGSINFLSLATFINLTNNQTVTITCDPIYSNWIAHLQSISYFSVVQSTQGFGLGNQIVWRGYATLPVPGFETNLGSGQGRASAMIVPLSTQSASGFPPATAYSQFYRTFTNDIDGGSQVISVNGAYHFICQENPWVIPADQNELFLLNETMNAIVQCDAHTATEGVSVTTENMSIIDIVDAIQTGSMPYVPSDLFGYGIDSSDNNNLIELQPLTIKYIKSLNFTQLGQYGNPGNYLMSEGGFLCYPSDSNYTAFIKKLNNDNTTNPNPLIWPHGDPLVEIVQNLGTGAPLTGLYRLVFNDYWTDSDWQTFEYSISVRPKMQVLRQGIGWWRSDGKFVLFNPISRKFITINVTAASGDTHAAAILSAVQSAGGITASVDSNGNLWFANVGNLFTPNPFYYGVTSGVDLNVLLPRRSHIMVV